MSDSLRPHDSQHARPPCPSPTPGVYSNSCPSSRWCHPDISSSVISFSSCPQSLPASGSFPMIQLFAWGGQSIGVSASVLPMNTQDWPPLGWTGWISLQSKGLSSLLQHRSSKASIFWCSAFFTVQLSHPYMTTGKTIALTRWTFVGKVMSLLSPPYPGPIHWNHREMSWPDFKCLKTIWFHFHQLESFIIVTQSSTQRTQQLEKRKTNRTGSV